MPSSSTPSGLPDRSQHAREEQGVTVGQLPQKHFSRYRKPRIDKPDFVENQRASYQWLITEGLTEIFKEFRSVKDFSEKKFEFQFTGFELQEPKYDQYYAKNNKLSYEAPLKVNIKLINKITGTEREQELFMTDFPVMTDHGTFIVGGIERVIVPQLARSYGVFFTAAVQNGVKMFGAKIIPNRGAWVEIETDKDGALYVRIDRKRKFPITTLLRVLGAPTEKDIMDLFDADHPIREYLVTSLEKDHAQNVEDAYLEIYSRLRDGDLASPENAKEFVDSIFSDERYDLSRVGRYHFNRRFHLGVEKADLKKQVIDLDDLIITLKHITELNTTPDAVEDDIDHLGFRRVRYVGDLMQQKIRVGMSQIKRNIQNRMSTIDTDVTLPVQFISPKPLQARIKEFFTTNQLSQFMQQHNALDELSHLRTLSALGPGGLNRARAGFEVRDVHPSHYGRLCPIQTPEGPNIGLILRLSTYARVNDFGMIETPYAVVKNGTITDEIHYLTAHEEEDFYIAHAGTVIDEKGKIKEKEIEVRKNGEPTLVSSEQVNYCDIATNQPFSVTTSMIPFLDNDDANRALMGSNMQRQATPCIVPEAPLVATGIEAMAVEDTGRVLYAREPGEVIEVDAKHIVIKTTKGKKDEYALISFARSNDFTLYHHRPVVKKGQKVKKGQLLADMASSDQGQMALGKNMLVGFMSWLGSNYEDAIIISERLVKKNKFTSVHIEEFVVNVRETKLGPEVTTCDIPNVGEIKLKNLGEDGIVRVGAEVWPGDILVGKITPKGETQLTPEERLLRSLFGEKARDVKDSSKRLGGGKRGRIINVKVFSREEGHKLDSGIIKRIHVEVAQLREISVGDKLAGRHGNKGVIARILPEEDMPFMADGTPLDVILTPLGVPSRMNIGQILELHLGMAANALDYQAVVPPFAGATAEEIREELTKAGFDQSGKVKRFDGRTGEAFDQDIAVGYMYILKLHHMVEDKVHQRSIGPYSLITQQPLGGKAQNGGQRFGEMEVWALLGYGAAYNLREMLTIKSDDIQGRSAAFDAIVKGEPIHQTNVPASFNVMLNVMRGLALDIQFEWKDRGPETQ